MKCISLGWMFLVVVTTSPFLSQACMSPPTTLHPWHSLLALLSPLLAPLLTASPNFEYPPLLASSFFFSLTADCLYVTYSPKFYRSVRVTHDPSFSLIIIPTMSFPRYYYHPFLQNLILYHLDDLNSFLDGFLASWFQSSLFPCKLCLSTLVTETFLNLDLYT